jgi:hypothetical protein
MRGRSTTGSAKRITLGDSYSAQWRCRPSIPMRHERELRYGASRRASRVSARYSRRSSSCTASCTASIRRAMFSCKAVPRISLFVACWLGSDLNGGQQPTALESSKEESERVSKLYSINLTTDLVGAECAPFFGESRVRRANIYMHGRMTRVGN